MVCVFLMRDTSSVIVNLSAIDHNMRVLRGLVGEGCSVCAVVKADAYGLGAARIAKRLSFLGADMLAVYSGSEAAELFRANAGGPVLVLEPIRRIDRTDDLYRGLITRMLHLTVHNLGQLADLTAMADQFAVEIPVHLEVDTGLARSGCPLMEAPEALSRIAAHRRLRLAGLFTHFASSDSDIERTDEQATKFDGFVDAHRRLIDSQCLIHMANTNATLRHDRFHRGMVRIGGGWSGCGGALMSSGPLLPGARELRLCLSWESEIVQTRRVDQGDIVGYGGLWKAPRATTLALVPVGYADGFPAGLANRSDASPQPPCVGVHVERSDGRCDVFYAPVVGRASMDQITIDVTEIQSPDAAVQRVRAGTKVELISTDADAPNSLFTLARNAQVLPYQIMCGLSQRIRRTYVTDEPAVVIPARGSRSATARHAVAAGG